MASKEAMTKIQMVDLHNQYLKIKDEIDDAIATTISTSRFIGGTTVDLFSNNLAEYLGINHVITCGNGTDALQIALMALQLEPGDEVIVPAFTYVATAEVIALLGLVPIIVDVHHDTFNINLGGADKFVTSKTKAIIPVHLFGQSSDMDAVMKFAKKHSLYVIEDNAQSVGATYDLNGENRSTGTIGDIGTYSFFPSKNLACYGDGGAISTNDPDLAKRIKMITSHGQSKKYYHDIIGVNSRLDNMQAGILDVKLKYLDDYINSRKQAANFYDEQLGNIEGLKIPHRDKKCTQVFHQYTLQVGDNRDALKNHLADHDIPSMIYYPLPLYKQKAYQHFVSDGFLLKTTENLCKSVLSLPIHTELEVEQQNHIVDTIKKFYS